MATDREEGRIRLYEDEFEEHERGVVGFLRRDKRLVFFLAAFALSSLTMRCASHQLDQAVEQEKAVKHEAAAKRNPWSKD